MLSPAVSGSQGYRELAPSLKKIIDFHEQGTLPEEEQVARRVILQKPVFTLEAGILYYLDR